VKELLDLFCEFRSTDSIGASEKAKIFGRGQHWVQCDFLGRYANHLTDRSRFVANTVTQ
jgi:hypothetical protein